MTGGVGAPRPPPPTLPRKFVKTGANALLREREKEAIMPSLPTPEAWAQIRYEYENTRRTVEDICLAYRISPNTLRRRVRQWRWTMRHPPIPDESPAAVAPPDLSSAEDSNAPDLLPPGLRLHEEMLRGDERTESATFLSGNGSNEAAAEDSRESEPSPHITAPRGDPAAADLPIGQRLQGAVARVLPAIETTLTRLANGPGRLREMELAARTLGALIRTLRELNGLLAQYRPSEPGEDTEELRRSLARQLEAVIAQEHEDIPRRYLAGWEEFAAEAAGDDRDDADTGLETTTPMQ